jgi:anaerobic selenocysteine-containing dehydrogenase
MRGNPDHPYSRGELCPKVNHFLDRVYSPDRITTPLVRTGEKGHGEFRRASWDEALELVADRITSEIGRHGGETVLPWSSAGTQGLLQMSSLDRRFFAHLGASRTVGALCGATARTGYALATGSGMSTDPTTVVHAKYVILWGTNTRLTNRHLWPFIEEARRNGAKVVVIDPIRTVTADAADWFIHVRPGTDVALILAMIHVIVREGWVDDDFVARHAKGFDQLVDRARSWTPERAAEECGVDADVIETLAREYATTTPALIRTLIGAEHRTNGGAIFSALAALPTVTGQWRHLGGGLSRSVGSWFGEFVDDSVYDPQPGRTSRALSFTQLGRVLTDTTLAPPVNVLFVWNGNPVITCPNAAAIRRGLVRDDLFTVVSEQFMTDTAKYADVIFPAATQIEQLDIVPAWGHLHLGWNEPAIEPVGESVPNTELWRRLARTLGCDDPLFALDDEALVRLALRGIDVDRMREEGYVTLPSADRRLFADGGFGHVDGRCDLGIVDHAPDRVPLAAEDDLILLSPKQHSRFLNSSYSHLPKHGPHEGSPYLEMTSVDASARGLIEGAMARVSNAQGHLDLRVRISARLTPGAVAVPFGWWDQDLDGHGAVNDLTSDAPTDCGGGVAYHDTLVHVEIA